jgi:hypothetical protein
MDEILKDLEKLGSSLEEAKSNLSREEGRLEEMYKSLKSEFEVENLKEAKLEVNSLTSELEEIENEIQKDYSELKSNYDWK